MTVPSLYVVPLTRLMIQLNIPLYQPSNQLIDFLQANNVTTTHFMIGQNILWNPQVFLKAFNAGHDIAVHTWTHPYMTTLTNEEVVAELGYTMEIIRNSTGGRVPKYWRPPYGDADNRVNAIAREVGHRFPFHL
jgi:chitin deacetylase